MKYMNQKKVNWLRVQTILIISFWVLQLFCSCNVEKQQQRKTMKELRGEGKHKWKGGPFPMNRKFIGY